MRPFNGQDLQGEEVEVIELLSSDEEDDYGPPPPLPAAAGPARAATPTELATPDDRGGEGPGEHGEAVESRVPTAAAGPPPAAHAPRSQRQKVPKSKSRRRGGVKRKLEQGSEEEQPSRGGPGPAVAGPSGVGPNSPSSPVRGHQRSLNEFYPVMRSSARGVAPKPPQEEAAVGPSAPRAAAAATAAPVPASQPPRFSSTAASTTFQVADDILGGLVADREGGGADAVAEVLAALLRSFRGGVPLSAAIPQDMFDERKQELIDEMMESHLAAELRASKEALAAAAAAERAGVAQAGELERELAAARAELEREKAERAGEVAALQADLVEARAAVKAASKRKWSLQRELAAAREELRGKEDAEKARAAAISGSCGVPTPSDAAVQGRRGDGDDDDAGAAAAPPPPPPLRAADLPKDVLFQAVLGLNNLAAIVGRSVDEAGRMQGVPVETPERLKARLDAVEKLRNAGKVVLVELNVWAEGADAATRWPGFTYSPRSHWAGVEVPFMGGQLYDRLRKAGMDAMEPGMRSVLGGSVAFPLLVTRTLIDGGKGWGLRALGPIPVGSCIIAYHGEYMTHEEAEEVKNATRGRAAEACFSFTLQACAACAAARTPAQLATIIRGGAQGPFRNLRSCVLDSRRRGNASRFFNHSCVPNCTSHEVDVPHGPTMTMQFALRDIQPGEELTLDYAQGWSSEDLQEALEEFNKKENHQKCFCRHARCRGWCF